MKRRRQNICLFTVCDAASLEASSTIVEHLPPVNQIVACSVQRHENLGSSGRMMRAGLHWCCAQ